MLTTREGRPADKKLPRLKLGMDNFAVRAMRWKAAELIEYAAKLELESLFITDLDALESLQTQHLHDIRARAADAGLQIHLGSWSICPTSNDFRNQWGTADEHLALTIRVAHDLGSPVARVILGSRRDRLSEGGIRARIDDTLPVLQRARSRALDAGVTIAVENHAGDMHSLELVELVRAAGPDYVGVNLDAGNALWTVEDPLQNLENLGPHVATTSIRDSAVWRSDRGATVQWTAMGEGDVDWTVYFRRFAELCPLAPVHIETISGFPMEIAYLDEEYWRAWPNGKPAGFDRFVALAERGKPRQPRQVAEGVDRKQADRDYQRSELERSIAYCRRAIPQFQD